MQNELFFLNPLGGSITSRRDVWLFLLIVCLVIVSIFDAYSVDPDQTPRSVASDLGLHCLRTSLFRALGINELR